MIEFQRTAFASLSEKSQLEISKIMIQHRFSDGEFITREGTTSDSFYLLLDGAAVVSRFSDNQEDPFFDKKFEQSIFEFKKLPAGRLLGESGFFDQLNRTQNIVAEGDCHVAQIRYDDLNTLFDRHPDCNVEIVKALGRHTVTRLRNSNFILVNDLRNKFINSYKKVFYNSFLLVLISVVLGLYFLDNLLQHFYSISPEVRFISNSTVIALLPFSYFFLKNRPSKKKFGLTFEGASRSLKYAFFVSLVLCFVIIIVKYVLLKLGYGFAYDRIFSMRIGRQVNYSTLQYWVNVIFYAANTLPQELVTRGFLQGSFDIVLENKSPWLSILLSNFIFMTVHVSLIGYFVSFLIFIVGLVWGWMYSKQKSLIGVTLSHAIVGVFGLFFVGFR